MGVDSNWMTPGNWSGNTLPQPNDDLDFPASASSLQAVNDFAAGTSFGSITIEASGYALSGKAVTLTGDINATFSSGTSTDSIDTNLGGGTVTVGAGGELDLSGVLSGSAGLTVSGGGTVDLSGNNIYNGMTSVNGNGTTLLVDGTIGTVQVNPAAVLGGSGTVGDVTTTAGTISPGDSPNVLHTGSLTLDGNSTYLAELDGGSTGNGTTGYDQIVASGAVDLDSALLDTGLGGGYVPTPGDQLTILQNNSGSDVTGTFAGLGEGTELIISGRPFGINYQGGASKQDVVLTALALTTIDVSASSGTSTFGDSVTFTANVMGSLGTPTGTVDFFDGNPNAGGTKLGSGGVDSQGVATFSTTTLDVAGSLHQIFAVYNPDVSGDYASSTTTQPASLTVNPAPLTITANDASKVYGDPLPTFTFSYSGFQNGDTASSLTTGPSIDTSATQFSPVTPDGYTITPTGAVDPDYTFTDVPGTLTVTTAPLTVTGLTANSKVYDGTPTDTLDTTSVALSGVLNSDDVSLDTSGYTASFADKNVGTGKAVTVSGLSLAGADAGNYALVQPTGLTADITTATITVSGVTANSKVYDGTPTDTLDTTSAALSGVVTGDDVSLDTSGATASFADKNVGTGKAVTVEGMTISGTDAGNYTLTQPTGLTANITAATVTVSGVTANSKVYDGTTTDTLDTTSAALSGVVSGDDVSLVTSGYTATFADQNAGTGVAVTVSGLSLSGADAGNYTLAQPAGLTADITRAILAVTANAQTMTYGGTVPALTYGVTGLVDGDTTGTVLSGSLATTGSSSSQVGGYPISIGTLVSDANYTISFTGATLSITPAPLTITASNAAIVYGAAIPAFTATYTGFVNGDTAAGLTTPPTLTTSATSTSPVGIYAINGSGASSSNYTISYVPGILVITQASSSASSSTSVFRAVVGQTVTYMVQVAAVSPGAGNPTGLVTFFVDGNPIGTAAVDAATGQALFSTTSTGLGTHAVAAVYSGDSNFQPTQASSSHIIVSTASTQPILTVQTVRNKRGKIVSVNLASQVLVVSPGSGVPTGAVTYFRNGHKIKKRTLGDGMAVLTLTPNQALNQSFTVKYSGDANFNPSASSKLVVTKNALKMSARPLNAFFTRGHARSGSHAS